MWGGSGMQQLAPAKHGSLNWQQAQRHTRFIDVHSK